jgi:hypothetical protein
MVVERSFPDQTTTDFKSLRKERLPLSCVPPTRWDRSRFDLGAAIWTLEAGVTSPGVSVLEALQRIGAGSQRTRDWQVVLAVGLPNVLSVFPGARWEGRWRDRDQRLLAAYGVGGQLVRMKDTLPASTPERLRRGDWDRVFSLLSQQAVVHEEPEWMLALLEGLLFAKHRWRLWRCGHGDHWYFGDYRRKEDCPAHRRAGQQARYRRGPRGGR